MTKNSNNIRHKTYQKKSITGFGRPTLYLQSGTREYCCSVEEWKVTFASNHNNRSSDQHDVSIVGFYISNLPTWCM